MAIKVSSVVLIVLIGAVAAGNVGRNSASLQSGVSSPRSDVNVILSGELAAVGSGSAGESHSEDIHVTGGWGHPANLDVSAGGESVLYQEGHIIQTTNVDADSVSTLNAVSVGQGALADEHLAVVADGSDITVGQSGNSQVAGEGASAVTADTSIIVS